MGTQISFIMMINACNYVCKYKGNEYIYLYISKIIPLESFDRNFTSFIEFNYYTVSNAQTHKFIPST